MISLRMIQTRYTAFLKLLWRRLKNIGVTLSGEVMSLQLAPQPDHSILLTVSSGKEDLGNMLRKAGESISKAFSNQRRVM